MPYTITRHDELRAGVFHVDGDIDIAVVPELRAALESLVESGVTNIVVDMEHVTYADSSALGLLVWLDGRLRDRDGRIMLSGANRDITRILEISGLVSVARTVSSSDSVQEALGGLESSRTEARLLWNAELEMTPDVEALAQVRERACDMLRPLRFSEAALFDIKVALGEALANAVRHGSSDAGGEIAVTLEAYEDRVAILVKDRGCGFDGVHSCSEDLYASGGRGIMFMRALMDLVEFEPAPDGGTVVKLVKHRSTDEPA